MLLNPQWIRKTHVLLLGVWSFMAWPSPLRASPVEHLPGPEFHVDLGMEAESPGMANDPLHIVDQLESTAINEPSFFDFSGDPASKPASAAEAVHYAGSGSWLAGLGFDSATGFDSGMNFDGSAEFDRGQTLHRGGNNPPAPLFFGRDEQAPIQPEKEAAFPPRQETGMGNQDQMTQKDKRPDSWTAQKKEMEELPQQERLEIESFKPVHKGLFIKIAFFVLAFFFLLTGMLKGLISIRFYFFLTILIIILWNPVESFLISIIIGLSALLAPLLG